MAFLRRKDSVDWLDPLLPVELWQSRVDSLGAST